MSLRREPLLDGEEERRASPPMRRRDEVSPSYATVLAIQRGAGNHALARLLASGPRRRTLARACNEPDEQAQVAAQTTHAMNIIQEGAAMIQAAQGRRFTPITSAPMSTPELLPRGGPSGESVTMSLESDDNGVVYQSDPEDEPGSWRADSDDIVYQSDPDDEEQSWGGVGSDEEMTDEPSSPGVTQHSDPLIFFPPTGQFVPLSLLLRHVPFAVLVQMGLLGAGGHGMNLHRTLARVKFTATEPRTKKSPTNKTFKFAGYTRGDNPNPHAATGVGDRTKVKRRGFQTGTPTNTTTRPPAWWAFIPLVGLGPGLGHCTYIMGHLLNEDFGGRGDEMYNLSPFTARLNARHKTQVETPLRRFLEGAATTGHTRRFDYTVAANYGTPTDVMNDAGARFDRFLTSNRTQALQTWVRLGLIDADDVPNLESALVTDAVALKAGGTWNVLVAQKRAEVVQYVNDRFPQSITCTAREYDIDPASGATDWDKTVTMVHDIAHVR